MGGRLCRAAGGPRGGAGLGAAGWTRASVCLCRAEGGSRGRAGCGAAEWRCAPLRLCRATRRRCSFLGFKLGVKPQTTCSPICGVDSIGSLTVRGGPSAELPYPGRRTVFCLAALCVCFCLCVFVCVCVFVCWSGVWSRV